MSFSVVYCSQFDNDNSIPMHYSHIFVGRWDQHTWLVKDGEAARPTRDDEAVPLLRAVGEGGVVEGHGESVRGLLVEAGTGSRIGDGAVGVLCAGTAS